MSTATVDKAPRRTVTEVMEIPLTHIAPSGTNPRKSFPPNELQDLASTIVAQGQVQAAVVRPWTATAEDVTRTKAAGAKPDFGPGDEMFLLVTGERRYRACLLGKVATLRAEIRDMNDADVLIVQHVENLQRERLDPMEEAEGYQALMASGLKQDVIAQRIGKSIQYVSARAKLCSLVDIGKDFLRKKWISPGHAVLVARLDEPEQEKALRAVFDEHGYNKKTPLDEIAADAMEDHEFGDFKPMTEKGLREWIKENVNLELKKAPWKLDDAELFPEAGACTTCEFKSGNNQALFSDLVDGDSKCMRPACYLEKQTRLIKIKLAEAKAAETPAAKISEKFAHTPPKETATQFKQGQWVEAKKGSCESTVLGVITDGEEAGKTKHVCTSVKCKVHKHPGIHSSSTGGGGSTYDWHAEQEKTRVEAAAETSIRLKMAEAALEKVSKMSDAMLIEIMTLAIGHHSDNFNKLFRPIGESKKLREFKSSTPTFAKGVAAVLLSQDVYAYSAQNGRKDFHDALTLIGADPESLRAQFAPKKEPAKPKEAAKPAKTAAKSKPPKKAPVAKKTKKKGRK